jgi:uncharacterized membrane protein YhaH (DUF805 family)
LHYKPSKKKNYWLETGTLVAMVMIVIVYDAKHADPTWYSPTAYWVIYTKIFYLVVKIKYCTNTQGHSSDEVFPPKQE